MCSHKKKSNNILRTIFPRYSYFFTALTICISLNAESLLFLHSSTKRSLERLRRLISALSVSVSSLDRQGKKPHPLFCLDLYNKSKEILQLREQPKNISSSLYQDFFTSLFLNSSQSHYSLHRSPSYFPFI